MPRLALFAVVLAACTDVPAITAGVCGNHVLDPGEDCDQATGCTATCQIACNPDQATTCTAGFDGACCPSGFACGTDGACRAPGGKLSASDITEPFEALELTVADIDHDHIADVLGVSSGAVEARYGSSSAPLAASAVRDAPFANGLPALGDYTGDGEPDVLIPTTGGLFGFETASGAPEPIAFPHQLDPGIAHFRIASLGGSDLLQVDATVLPGDMKPTLVVSRDGVTPQRPCLAAKDVDPALLRGRGIHPWNDSSGLANSRELLPLAFLGPTMTESTICVHAMTSSGIAPFGGVIDLGARVTTIPADGETFYADLDQNATTCPDLLVPAIGPGNQEKTLLVPGVGLPGACTLAMDPLVMDHLKYTDNFAAGLPLGVLHVKTAAGLQLALVTSAGIYVLDSAGRNPQAIAGATRTWRFVAIGDFDHDGYDDIATGATSEDAEILLQVPATASAPVTFRQLRIVTGGGVAQLATGDFDGDGIADVAMATADLANDRTAQLEVVYGGPLLGVLPPVTGPSFPEFDGFVVSQLVDPALPPGYDHSDDLIAAYGNDDLSGNGKLAQIFGSSTRALTAPYLFSSSFGSTTGGTLPGLGVLAAIGKYGTDQGLGVLALFTHRDNGPIAGNVLGYAWTQLGWTDDGTFSEVTQDVAFDPTYSVEQLAFTNLTVKDGELLIGFLGAGNVCKAGYYLAGQTPNLMLTTSDCSAIAPGVDAATVATLGEATSVSSYPATDASSDGTLIVRKLAVAGRSYAVHRWNLHVTAGVATLTDPVDYTAEVGADGCMDAAPIELGGPEAGFGDGPEWLVACRMPVGMGRFSTQVFAGFVDSAGQRHYTELFDTGADVVVTVRAGDLNGDGVQDVIYLAGPPGFGSVHLRLQCDSHGVCQGGS